MEFKQGDTLISSYTDTVNKVTENKLYTVDKVNEEGFCIVNDDGVEVYPNESSFTKLEFNGIF
ncbi:hypothetical protein BAOM_2992 [Peribacillus asahii]|uniref:Uncharacterized protein n=1 Tax=Peribacillus asahii TaxID=228899 RepID=A0A3Q9RNB0_9BACI|nr:hypothetical protein [Peribacillus asahii]AZV43601.1 hypothetical protein BAOM_2992 [Peribacillus asahii]